MISGSRETLLTDFPFSPILLNKHVIDLFDKKNALIDYENNR